MTAMTPPIMMVCERLSFDCAWVLNSIGMNQQRPSLLIFLSAPLKCDELNLT